MTKKPAILKPLRDKFYRHHKGGYAAKFSVERPLFDFGDSHPGIVDVSGSAVFIADADKGEERPVVVATLTGQVIDLGKFTSFEELEDAVDVHSDDLTDLVKTLVSPKVSESYYDRSTWRHTTKLAFGRYSADLGHPEGGYHEPDHAQLLVVDRVKVTDSAHKGHGVGLALTKEFIDLFGKGQGAAALFPYPQQFPLMDMPWDDMVKRPEFLEARAKLTEHWSKLGFKSVGKTGYMVMNLERNQPSRADLGLAETKG